MLVLQIMEGLKSIKWSQERDSIDGKSEDSYIFLEFEVYRDGDDLKPIGPHFFQRNALDILLQRVMRDAQEVAEIKFQEKLIPTNGFIRRYTPENRNSVMLHTDTFDYSAVILLTPRSERTGGELFVYPLEVLSSRLKGDFLTAILPPQSVMLPENMNVSSKFDASSDYGVWKSLRS